MFTLQYIWSFYILDFSPVAIWIAICEAKSRLGKKERKSGVSAKGGRHP
jgi:hypothetical protein